jgi:hypothetical protein
MNAPIHHVLPKTLLEDPTFEYNPNAVHGAVVRVHDFGGKPTGFIGVVTRMRRSEFGLQCDVSGAGRRLVVPLALLSRATVDQLTYTNVHKPGTGKNAMHIDGEKSAL